MKLIQHLILICVFGTISSFDLSVQANNLVWEDAIKFDLHTLKKNKDKKDFYSYNTTDTKGNPLKITLIDDAEFYTEYIEKVGTPFTIEKKYYKNNLNLAQKSFKFYSVKYDYSYYFDELGNISNKTNEENGIEFSIPDLHELMLRKYGMDLYKVSDNTDENFIVQRSKDPYVYYIKKPLNTTIGTTILVNGLRQDLYEIDAKTGEVISSPTQSSSRKNEMLDIIKKRQSEIINDSLK